MDKKLDILADEVLDGVAGGVGTGDESASMNPDDEEKMREQHNTPTQA